MSPWKVDNCCVCGEQAHEFVSEVAYQDRAFCGPECKRQFWASLQEWPYNAPACDVLSDDYHYSTQL